MKKPSDAAALIVHYNSHETLHYTVKSLSKFFEPHRLFVIDNSSSLGKNNPISLLATVIDDGKNHGYAGGVNRGMSHISSISSIEEVLVCTHETIFRADAIELLFETASRNPEGHIVAPQLITTKADGRESIWSNGGTLSFPFSYPRHNTSLSRSGVRKARWVDGAAFVISVSTWRRVGGVPEEFFMYMEDVALGLRCRQLKIPVLVNLSAVVEQTANGPSRKLAIRNRAILAMRYMSRPRRHAVLTELRLRSLLMALLPNTNSKSKSRESRDAVAEAASIVRGLGKASS